MLLFALYTSSWLRLRKKRRRTSFINSFSVASSFVLGVSFGEAEGSLGGVVFGVLVGVEEGSLVGAVLGSVGSGVGPPEGLSVFSEDFLSGCYC